MFKQLAQIVSIIKQHARDYMQDIFSVIRVSRPLSNQDTIRTDSSVLNSELSSFQRLLSIQMWYLGQIQVS